MANQKTTERHAARHLTTLAEREKTRHRWDLDRMLDEGEGTGVDWDDLPAEDGDDG